MRWFVFIDGQIYGPYSPEQLTAFLKPDTLVVRENEAEWVPAESDPALADVLSGKIKPVLEWYVKKGGEVRGPMTQVALMAMIERNEILPTDAIRHEHWTSFAPLEQTKLFLKWKNPTADLGDLTATGRPAPRIVYELLPDGPSKLRQFLKIPRGGTALIVASVFIIVGISVWSWNRVSGDIDPADHPVVQRCGGVPQGSCAKDARSRCICEERPFYCGCQVKGSCGMKSCQNYAEMLKNPPPPEAMGGRAP